jgi:hypothetical protein
VGSQKLRIWRETRSVATPGRPEGRKTHWAEPGSASSGASDTRSALDGEGMRTETLGAAEPRASVA